MSELKAILATPHPKMKNACDGAIEVYPKSEADKVIAKLEEKLDTTEKLLNKALDCISNGKNHMMSLARKNNHANYKLCLAMARWCESEEKRLEAIDPCFDTDKERREYYISYWVKWRQIWLELAEKFKEAK